MNKSIILLSMFFMYPLMAMDNDLNGKLYRAATHKTPNLDQIRTLIEAKADVNHFVHLQSVLHWTITYGTQKACLMLLEAGANPNNVKQGEAHTFSTPLIGAINHGYIDASRLMIENGADIHLEDSYGFTPLWAACNKNLFPICKLLMSAIYGNIHLFKLLLANGANFHANPEDETVLLTAAKHNQYKMIVAILNHVLFPSKSKAQARAVMYSLARLRATNPIINELSRHAKSLLAPWLLWNSITPANKDACINLMEMRDKYGRCAFGYFSISLLNPKNIDETIHYLIKGQLNGENQ